MFSRISSTVVATVVILLCTQQSVFGFGYGSGGGRRSSDGERTYDWSENPYYGNTHLELGFYRLTEQNEDRVNHQGYGVELNWSWFPANRENRAVNEDRAFAPCFHYGLNILPARSPLWGGEANEEYRFQHIPELEIFIINAPESGFLSVGVGIFWEHVFPFDDADDPDVDETADNFVHPQDGFEMFGGKFDFSGGFVTSNFSIKLNWSYILGYGIFERKYESISYKGSFGIFASNTFDIFLRYQYLLDRQKKNDTGVYDYDRQFHFVEVDLTWHADPLFALSLDARYLLSGEDKTSGYQDQSNFKISLTLIFSF